MTTVVIVIHLMVVLAMIGLVLLQRSEGGALGIGGGSGAFLSGRGAGNVLTRSTGILAAVFFATSIGLALLARIESRPSDIFDQLPGQAARRSRGRRRLRFPPAHRRARRNCCVRWAGRRRDRKRRLLAPLNPPRQRRTRQRLRRPLRRSRSPVATGARRLRPGGSAGLAAPGSGHPAIIRA
jgi:preprotein translocase subunit SecG